MIRNFIYLDEEKMYSLSSQMFSGVKDFILNENHTSKVEEEDQKGPIGSGRVIGKAMKNNFTQTERVSLHDFAYTEFEEKLISDSKVYQPQECSDQDFKKMSFIKIRGRAIINDIEYLKKMFSGFNEIGDSLVYTQVADEIKNIETQIDVINSQSGLKDKKSKVDELKKKIDLKALKEVIFPDFPSERMVIALNDLLSFAYQDSFEVQVYSESNLFSSILKREYLRENEGLIVKKYGRKTEVEFVLFGIMTQKIATSDKEDIKPIFKSEFSEAKAGIMDLIDNFSVLEDNLSGVMKNEIIVDPIALYTEI